MYRVASDRLCALQVDLAFTPVQLGAITLAQSLAGAVHCHSSALPSGYLTVCHLQLSAPLWGYIADTRPRKSLLAAGYY